MRLHAQRAIAATSVLALVVALGTGLGGAQTIGANKYPDWRGQWTWSGLTPGSFSFASWDPTKPRGLGQQAPLTREYQAMFETGLADQRKGGQGADPTFTCLPPGMPRMMRAVLPIEFLVTPETTYILFEARGGRRRIFTDGREWPAEFLPDFAGTSIGHWEDSDGDGRFDTLLVETRAMRGPHVYDSTGIPFHKDGQAVIKERIYQDKNNPNLLYDEVTSIDNALTHPWTVKRPYSRAPDKEPHWGENYCAEGNRQVQIGPEQYMVSGEGYLLPIRKDQPPPDLKYFNQ